MRTDVVGKHAVSWSDEEVDDDTGLSASVRAPPSPVAIGHSVGHRNKRRKIEKPRPIQLLAEDEYRYSDILPDETRLLVLYPSSTSAGPIRCSLVTVPFSQLGEGRFHFEALSYSWGDDEPADVIYLQDHKFVNSTASQEYVRNQVGRRLRCQDDAQGAPFRVRSQLMSALTQLRRLSSKVHLWIDAVCINQDNGAEKSLQISKMAIIYSRAQNVRIWLGECDPVQHSDEAMQFVDEIVDLSLLDHLVTRHPTDHSWNTKTCRSWMAFSNILKRSWFRRRWVIQEVAFAKSASVQCGAVEKNWIDFADAIELFVEKLDQIRMFYGSTELAVQDPDVFKGAEAFGASALVAVSGTVFRRLNSGHSFERTWNIETLVSKLISFEVTDPRDAIFALSSMAKNESVKATQHRSEHLLQNLQVDYGKHPVEVYTDFVRHSIQSSKSLDIICRHWAFPVSEDASIIQDWWFKAAGAWLREESGMSAATTRISDEYIPVHTGLEIEPYRHGPDFQKLSLDGLTDFLIAIDNVIRQLKQILSHLSEIQDRSQFHQAISSASSLENAQMYGFVASNMLKLRKALMNRFISKLFQGPRNRLNHSHSNPEEDRNLDEHGSYSYGPVSFVRHSLQSKGPGFSWTMRTSLSLVWGICWVFHNYGYAQNTSASSKGRRSPFTVHKRPHIGVLETQLPSWIGLLEESVFGPPHTGSGREIAGSLVGEPGQPIYNASNGLDPDVDFGQIDHRAVIEKAPVSDLLAIGPAQQSFEPSSSMAKLLQHLTPDANANRLTPNRFDGRLSVKGIILSRIVWTSPRVVEGIIPGEGLQKLGWQLDDDLYNVPDTVWRILVADRGPDSKQSPSFYRRACLYCLSNANSKGDINTERLIRDQSQPQTVRKFIDRVRSIVWNRRFFATEDRDAILGLAPNNAKSGDYVCVLFGCSVPVVLRKHDDYRGGTHCELVGECYAHGRMAGEAVSGMTAEELSRTTETFVLH